MKCKLGPAAERRMHLLNGLVLIRVCPEPTPPLPGTNVHIVSVISPSFAPLADISILERSRAE